MTQSLIRWCAAVALLVALGCLMLTRPAGADWPQDAFTCKSYRKDLVWRDWARRHCRGWRHRHHRRVTTRYVVVSRGDALCQPAVARTGDQAQSEEAAYENAVTAWRGEVRFLYGERFTDPKRWRDRDKDCAPSSVPDSARDKALSSLYRCRITARPCRVEAKRIGRDED